MSYLPETQMLTLSGWKTFDLLTSTDKIACVTENKELMFSDIKHIQIDSYDGQMINISNKVRSANITVTPTHKVVIEHKLASNGKNKSKIPSGNLVLVSAEEVAYHTSMLHYVTFPKYCGSMDTLTFMDRFLIAFQADGIKEPLSYNPKTKVYTYGFHFSKKRKIQRLKYILNNLKLQYKESQRLDGTTVINVKLQDKLPKSFWKLDMSDLTCHYAYEFISELKNWDGYSPEDKHYVEYQTVDHIASDVVQSICAIGGFRFKDVLLPPVNENCKVKHRINVVNTNKVGGGTISKRKMHYSGDVFSIVADFNKMLVKLNGVMAVCGTN